MCEVSVVVPVYKGENCVKELVSRTTRVLESLFRDYEIILVNDGSPDDSWDRILELTRQDHRVKGIMLSRNFGQHYAITAGLEHTSSEWIVVMDCDMQDVPEDIPKLYAKAEEGFDLVLAQRLQRKDAFLKRLSSKCFYAIFGFLTDSKLDSSIANFGIYRREVIRSVLAMQDHIRFFPTMVQWVGFRFAYLPVSHAARPHGHSSYSLGKLITLATDNIIAFSNKPLHLAVRLGMLISLLSTVTAAFFLIRYISGHIIVSGYTSLILSMWFLSGCIIFVLGVVGLYVGKAFDQVKSRPLYIIQARVNLEENHAPNLGL